MESPQNVWACPTLKLAPAVLTVTEPDLEGGTSDLLGSIVNITPMRPGCVTLGPIGVLTIRSVFLYLPKPRPLKSDTAHHIARGLDDAFLTTSNSVAVIGFTVSVLRARNELALAGSVPINNAKAAHPMTFTFMSHAPKSIMSIKSTAVVVAIKAFAKTTTTNDSGDYLLRTKKAASIRSGLVSNAQNCCDLLIQE
jgi:hypothetical protein